MQIYCKYLGVVVREKMGEKEREEKGADLKRAIEERKQRETYPCT